MKILVIDDEEVFRILLSTILEFDGHEIISCPNGDLGIKKARDWSPDLILLDAMMPGKDGFQTCKIFKGDPHLKKHPIIMLTALDKIVDIDTAFSAGADEYISKPINENTFEGILMRKYQRVISNN
jgi:CheY-like chemotaxis protein